MRTLSLTFRQALFAQQSGEVAIFLLTIAHPDLDDPILLSSDPTSRLSTTPLMYGTVSRGNTYYFVGMDISLPDEQDKAPPASKLIISNVDRSIIPLVRSITAPAQVQIEGLLASDLDTVEFSIPAMDIIGVNYDAAQLTFDLAMDAFATEPSPAGAFSPAYFPGLYA